MKYLLILVFIFIQSVFSKDIFFYQNGKKVTLVPQNSMSRNYSNVDYYMTDRGVSLGVADTMIVKFKNPKNLTNYLGEFGLGIVKKISKNIYLLKSSSKAFTIDIANSLSQKSDVAYAQPNFIKKIIER